VLAGAAIVVSSSASAGTPSVAGMTYDACGKWKGKMRNYGRYKLEDYNQWVPPNLAVPPNEATPGSVWQFYDDGISLGHPTDDAFVAILDIVDEMGTSLPQTITGSWKQKKNNLRMNVDLDQVTDVFVDPAGVRIVQNDFTTTGPHGLYDLQGPFRFLPGGLVGGAVGVLPGGVNATTDYYVIYVSPTIFGVSLSPGGPAVDITSQGTGRHNLYAFGEPLPNTFSILSELFLFGDREVVGVVDYVTVDKVKLKGRLKKKGTELKIKLTTRTSYDIDTDDVVAQDFPGKLKYDAQTSKCTP